MFTWHDLLNFLFIPQLILLFSDKFTDRKSDRCLSLSSSCPKQKSHSQKASRSFFFFLLSLSSNTNHREKQLILSSLCNADVERLWYNGGRHGNRGSSGLPDSLRKDLSRLRFFSVQKWPSFHLHAVYSATQRGNLIEINSLVKPK